MTTQISINILHGSASVTNEDRERAEAAALKVLGSVEPGTAYAEYQRQWSDLDSTDDMTGLAALWIAAEKAADLALTDGWHNPDGAACSISA
jgi:hypothetical protein